jgi:four helix bundle protein
LYGSAQTICSSRFIALRLQCFPSEEQYELGRQVRKSAYSVPANIVEGNARESTREALRFLNIASASLNETGYGLHAAHRLGYLTDEVYYQLEADIKAVAAPLNGLIKSKRASLITKVIDIGHSGSFCDANSAMAALDRKSWSP